MLYVVTISWLDLLYYRLLNTYVAHLSLGGNGILVCLGTSIQAAAVRVWLIACLLFSHCYVLSIFVQSDLNCQSTIFALQILSQT